MSDFHLYLYGPDQGPLASSFEQAEERLTALANLYFEPDGSFVWALEGGKQQVFGMIYDAAGQIQYTELRGSCRWSTWRQIIDAISGGKSFNGQVLQLPKQQLQELQSFESELWPAADRERE